MDAPPQVAAGTLIGGDFRIQRPLSAGGMGAVYVAEQLSTGKPRALKLMHPQLVSDPKSRLRFIDEARVGARIPSEHVVEVVGAGVDDATGVPWLAMELLEGEDLSAIVERTGPLPVASARELMLQLGHALGAAHGQSIVHRDLKPENVFVARSRRRGAELTVKVLDFGIAKTLESSRTAATATAAMGSPLFMAPEQATPGAAIRPQTDVWALGLIGLYALTGRFYWRSASIEPFSLQALLAEVLVHPMPTATERLRELGAAVSLPPGFDAWFARCVARDPAGRFSDASACVAAFDAMLQGNLHPSMPGQVALAATAAMGAVTPMPGGYGAGPYTPPPGHATPPLGGHTPPPVASTAYMQPMPGPPPTYATPTRSGGGLLGMLAVIGAVGLLAIVGIGGAVAAWSLSGREDPVPPSPARPPAAPPTPPAMDPILPREPEPEPEPEVAPEPTPEPPLVDEAPPVEDPPSTARGTLMINTSPWSTVFIDGERLGATPIVNASVAPGRHELRAETSDGRTETWSVVVRAGQTHRIIRRLSPSGPSSPGTGDPTPNVPLRPTRTDVVSAMNGVSGAVRACANGSHGVAPVRVVFAGPTGRVVSAAVTGSSFPPAVTSCIARAVRGARVPPFRDATFSVNYPFRL